MADDIFEESVITIEATLKEGGFFSGSYTGKLDLIYQKNDADIKKESDIDVPAGTVSRTYNVPKVEGTEDTYNLKVIAHYGKQKEKTRVLVEATVWPKKVKITAKDLKDNGPAKKLPYDVNHTSLWFGGTTNGNTDDNGVGNEDLKKSPYTITVKAPWEITANKNDVHKREHELTVRYNAKAKFVKPDITKPCYVPAGEPTDDKKLGVRQYVNAPTAEAGCDANNNVIEFEVSHKDTGPGRSGDKIYVRVKFSKLSKRTTPKPALLAPCQGIVESDGGKTFNGFVLLSGDGGTAKFNVNLGYAGGETFTVSCGYSKDDPTDDTLTFVTWRKVTYQLRFPTAMKTRMTERTRVNGTKYFDLPDGVYNVVKTRLKPVFVEYENKKSIEFTPPVDDPSIVTKGFLRNTADADPFYVIDENLVWNGGAPPFDPVAENRETTITLCDAALDIDTKVLSPTWVMKAAETKDLVLEDNTNYLYFAKKPFQANTPNVVVAGYKWKADLSGVAATDKSHKPAFSVTFSKQDFDDWNDFQVQEKDAGAAPLAVSFGDTNALTGPGKTALKTYYENCFNNAKAIRKNQNQLKFVVAGGDSDADDKERAKAITDELNSIHTASTKKVLYHPGMDEDGNDLQGEMSEVEFVHQSSKKVTIKLPVRAAATDPFKPGDFAGDPSATKCPVKVEFSITGAYTYNGHAGGGAQVLVLRDAIPEAIASTVCHELGHAMGMAIMPLASGHAMPIPPGLGPQKHVDEGGTYYRNKANAPFDSGFRKRHQGPHCCKGIPPEKIPFQSFDGWGTKGTAKICIMWGEGGATDDRTQYCPACTEVIKARDLRDVRKNWAGSADG